MEVDKQVLAGESAGAILDAFLSTVAKFPDDIALTNEKESLTFSEVASQCSSYFKQIDYLIQESDLAGYVPIFVSRDLPSAVSVLACYLYGVPFSPISADWPADRLIQVLNKLGMPPFGIVSPNKQEAVSRAVPKTFQLFSFSTKEHQPLESHTGHALTLNQGLGQVLFTSGTTGEPKGVEFDRTALSKKLAFQVSRSSNDQDQLGEKISSVLGYPLNFTAGVGRLLGVVAGESVRILSESEMQIDKFIDLVRRTEPKVLRLPPSLLILLSKHPAQDFERPIFPSVRQVSWGGDALSFSTIHNLKTYFSPNTEMMSGFGATEGSNGLNFRFLIGDSPAVGPMPLGLKVSIDDAALERLDDSEDLYVLRSFQNLATGYIGDPGLTSERFRFDSAGRRYWYSGDVVQIDHDGNIWHKGRVDDLVKIRGMLSSPSEATRSLMQIPGIFDAVVLPDKTGEQVKLVAHVAMNPVKGPSLSEIRKTLATQLPSHLIPSIFVAHEVLPKNDRGKPDRRLLLGNEWTPLIEPQFKPPVTPSEHAVTSHLLDILCLPQISIDENLWNAGLDSLAALELEVRLKNDFPTVGLDLISKHSTIRSLGRALDNLLRHGGFRESHVLNSKGSLPPIYAFPGAGNLTTHYVHLARALDGDIPIVCFLADPKEPSADNTSVTGRVNHALGRIAIIPGQRVNLVGYSLGGAYAFALAKVLAGRGCKVNLIFFDTSYDLVSASKSRSFAAMRPKTANPATQFGRSASLVSDLRHVYKTHGLKRAISLILNQLLELLMSIGILRNFLRVAATNFTRIFRVIPHSKLIDSFMRHDLSDYNFQPFSVNELELVNSYYFYIGEQPPAQEWKLLIPNVNFIKSRGNHLNMLNPPHVATLAEVLLQIIQEQRSA